MAQSKVKIKTAYPGVRYREHPTRKHGSVNKDRYYFIRYKVNGKDKEEGVGWSKADKMTPEKAAAILSQIRENIRLGKGPQSLAEMKAENKAAEARKKELEEQTEKQTITFGKFFEETYLPHAINQKKDCSVAPEKGYYNKWISPVLKDMHFIDINRKHIDKILGNISSANSSKRTKNYVLSIISIIWKHARSYGIIDCDCPAKECMIKRIENERTRFLSEEEAELILDELKKEDLLVHDIALLSLLCGLRAGEIFKLKWSDINFHDKSIKIMNTKASKTRYAWFGDEIEDMLIKRKQTSLNDDLIFKTDKGIINFYVSRTFKKIIDNLGLNDNITDNKERLVFHSLRHTYASWLAKKGVPAYNIMKLMGHSSFKMMQRYAHLTDNTLKNSASVLNNILDVKNKDNGSQGGQDEQNQ